MKNKILIVDDDKNIVELLKINLSQYNYEINFAFNGKEAIDIVYNNKPDIIILDIMMPEIDGWELCKILKDHHEYSDIKIIFLSARDTERDILIGKGIFKADEYITKPFKIENLLKIVKQLLEEND